MTEVRLTALLLLCGIACAACQSRGDHREIRIGAKPFAEQAVLAEALRILVIDQGFDAEIVPCDDTFDCQRRLRASDLDLMVEYTGTALLLAGGPRPDRENPIEQVRRLYSPLGLQWLEPLGFDNSYRILVKSTLAESSRIRTIADLDRLEPGIRLGSPQEFLRRSRDGLPALLRRYGLRLAGEPVIIAEASERFHALRRGDQINVAVGYSTDGAMAGLGLTELEDPLAFFPPYQAAVVARDDTLSSHPGLEEQLGLLSGTLDDAKMRQLNVAVQVEGQTPQAVVYRFLRENGILDDDTSAEEAHPQSTVSLSRNDSSGLQPELATATRAMRHLFPARNIRHHRTSAPLNAVEAGRAHFAVVTADRFFTRRGHRDERFEAVAVLATHFVHVVRRADDTAASPLDGRLGLQPRGTSGARLAAALARDATRPRHATVAALMQQLRDRDLDAAIIVTRQGAPELARELRRGGAALVPLQRWLTSQRAISLPYLQRARIPAATYPGQTDPVDSLSVQVVIAAPSRSRLSASVAGVGGPAAALPSRLPPLSQTQLDRLAESIGVLEVPDAVLPSARVPATTDQHAGDQGWSMTSILETVINALVIAYLIWLAVLFYRQREPTTS